MSDRNKKKLHVYVLTEEYTPDNDPTNDRYRILGVYSDRASAEHRLSRITHKQGCEHRIIRQTVKGQLDYFDVINQLSI